MQRGALNIAVTAVLAVLWLSTGIAADTQGADSKSTELRPDGSTPLQWAVFNGDVAEAKRLLAAGADVKAENIYGADAMQLAADNANTGMIQLLLKAGANPDSPNPEGETALHLVARAGNVDAAKLLLKAGAKVDLREHFGEQSPLMWAVARRHPDMVELLASKGADVNARSAIRDYQRVATAESRGKQLDRGGLTPLLYAARENCRECVEILLKHKVDVDLPDPSGMAPVTIAIMNSNWDIARRLIEAGADVNQWDIFGQSPLHVAIGNMNSTGNGSPLDSDKPNKATGREIVQMLVDRGANPNQQTYFRAAGRGFGGTGRDTTPFLTACAGGNIEVVKLLLDHGANPKLATADGQGPIILAVGSRTGGTGNPGAARGGAGGGRAPPGAGAPARTGAPAGGPARANPTVELIKLLAASGADVNLMSKRHFLQRTRGGSALHYAVRAGNKEVMAALVELGIDVNAKDEDGLTALDYAMGRGYVPFLQMAQPPRKDLADMVRGWGGNVELAKTPDWPPQGAPIATVVYDAVIWPVDPVGP
jgi:ankyrin repeat protein